MKKIKLLAPILGASLIGSPVLTLASCSPITIFVDVALDSSVEHIQMETTPSQPAFGKELIITLTADNQYKIDYDSIKITQNQKELETKIELKDDDRIATVTIDKIDDINEILVFANAINQISYEYDLTKPIVPTIKQKEGTFSWQENTKGYCEDINNNQQIFADDLAYSWYNTGIASLGGYEKIIVTPLHSDVSKSYVSFKIHSFGKVVNPYDPQDPDIGKDFIADFELQNIPIQCCYFKDTTMNGMWGMQPSIGNGEVLLENDDWSYYEKKTIDGKEPEIVEWNAQKLRDDPMQEQDISYVSYLLCFTLPNISYYLSNTELKYIANWIFVDENGHHNYPYSSDPIPQYAQPDPLDEIECLNVYKDSVSSAPLCLLDDFMSGFDYLVDPKNVTEYSAEINITSFDFDKKEMSISAHLHYISKENGLYDFEFTFENMPFILGWAPDGLSLTKWVIAQVYAPPALKLKTDWNYHWSGIVKDKEMDDVELNYQSTTNDILDEIYREEGGWYCSSYTSRFLENIQYDEPVIK